MPTPAPPAPPGGPSDWTYAVHGNYFANIQRLGRWTGGTTSIPSGKDPSKSFQSVAPASIGRGSNPPSIYVVSHGWAPTYRQIIPKDGNILWWSSNASLGGLWAGDWAWAPVTAPGPFAVNPNGLLPSIAAFDPNAVVLAWSWIDDSATDNGLSSMIDVYRSEAYTHVNGTRLAYALLMAIHSDFWLHGGTLRIIGHSHGSKVATVAALTLQQRGYPVRHLTLLDSPESEMTLNANGANLLGFYLEQMQIENPSFKCTSGAFVDNNASCFGVAYKGTPNLQNIVEVALYPKQLYDSLDYSDQHGYAPAWYGGAAAGAVSQKEPSLGFAWPPPPASFTPALNQNWPTGTNQYSQWQLQPGPSIHDTYSYSTVPMDVTTVSMRGNVSGAPSTALVFRPAAGTWPAWSIFQGSYHNPLFSDKYGVAFDLSWLGPQPGDYLVVTMPSPDLHKQETLLVLDGQSYFPGNTSVAINVDASGRHNIYIYFLAANGNTTGRVAVANFRFVEVKSASGYLEARRLAKAEERTRVRSLTAPSLQPAPNSTA